MIQRMLKRKVWQAGPNLRRGVHIRQRIWIGGVQIRQQIWTGGPNPRGVQIRCDKDDRLTAGAWATCELRGSNARKLCATNHNGLIKFTQYKGRWREILFQHNADYITVAKRDKEMKQRQRHIMYMTRTSKTTQFTGPILM